MKYLLFLCSCVMMIASGCEGWAVQPIPYITPTPFPTHTPSIYTATSIILPPPITLTPSITPALPTQSSNTPTALALPTSTDTPSNPTFTPTEPSPGISTTVEILGCNTSLDISHGMGEVTNAYVTVSNLGNRDLGNFCATLSGLDEGRLTPTKPCARPRCLPIIK